LSSVTHIWVQMPALFIPSVSSYTGEDYIDVPLAATFSNFTGKILVLEGYKLHRASVIQSLLLIEPSQCHRLRFLLVLVQAELK
jgi:hypothetical protein